MNLTVRKLNNTETTYAKHFLYEIYANQLHWTPAQGNRSQWVVLEDGSGNYFDDMYNRASQWFGVYSGNTLIASGRIIFPIQDKLEIELYNEIPEKYKLPNIHRVEINRFAIDKSYNGSAAISLLFQAIITYACNNHVHYIFTAAPPATLSLVKEVGFTVVNTFKYNKTDSHAVFCSMLDCSDRKAIDSIITGLAHKKLNLEFF